MRGRKWQDPSGRLREACPFFRAECGLEGTIGSWQDVGVVLAP
jgi:hypothetical protein